MVDVWWCFAVDTDGDSLKIQGQHGYHSILHQEPGLRLVGPSFFFQHDNDPEHSPRLREMESDASPGLHCSEEKAAKCSTYMETTSKLLKTIPGDHLIKT